MSDRPADAHPQSTPDETRLTTNFHQEDRPDSESGETRTVPPRAAGTDAHAEGATVAPEAGRTIGTTTAEIQIPGYEILSELGRGGMGVVYKVRHVHLNRLVALKMILAGAHAGADDLARFRTEAEAVARLQHPGIVQIYEIGEHKGLPFFSLEFCSGGSLDNTLAGTPMQPAAAADLVQKLAEAMQTAHEANVVHRDLKPANVLMDANGNPKITDFGLAKKLDEAGQTQSGAVMGTPSYMAPEQAGGQKDQIGPATDVYALGAILYDCLTGRPPFRAATAMDTILQVISVEPVPPRELQPGIPKDLETICLKCLQKDARRRYSSALALSDDLQKCQNNEPIEARPVGRAERAWRWCRRNPAVASLITGVILVLLSGAGISTWFGMQARLNATRAFRSAKLAKQNAAKEADARKVAQQEAKAKEQARQIAQTERDRFLHQLYVSDMRLAHSDWTNTNLQRMSELLSRHGPGRSYSQDLRGFEWDYLDRLVHGFLVNCTEHTDSVLCVDISGDGQRIVSGSRDKTVRMWNAVSGKETLILKGHISKVTSVVLSSDGKTIVSGSEDGTVKLWSTDAGEEIRTLKGHTGGVNCVAFSPDEKWVASGSWDGTVRLWDVEAGREMRIIGDKFSEVYSVAFSPDGKQVVSGGGRKALAVWDARTGKNVHYLQGHTCSIHSAAFSPDGKRIVSGSWQYNKPGELIVWDAKTGKEALRIRNRIGGALSVAFSPDGNLIVSGGNDRTVQLWDATTGKNLMSRKGHTGSITSVTFSSDGQRIVSGSLDRTVKVWHANSTDQGARTLEGPHGARVASVAFSPDGKRFLTGGGATVALWGMGEEPLIFKGHKLSVSSVAFSPDGKRIVSATGEPHVTSRGEVKVWDVSNHKEILSLDSHRFGVFCVVFSPDGKRIASGGEGEDISAPSGKNGELKIWNAVTGEEIVNLRGHVAGVSSVTFSADGQRIVSGSWDTSIKIWDATTGKVIRTLQGHKREVNSIAMSRAGRWIVSGSSDGTVKVWEVATGKEKAAFKGHNSGVTSVAFSSDDTRVVSASRDKTVKLWDVETGEEVLTLRQPRHFVFSVAFSPDGKGILSGGGAPGTTSSEVIIWNAGNN